MTRGKYAIVDPDDYDSLSQHKWFAQPTSRTFYTVRHIYMKNNQKKYVPMHRVVIQAPDGIFVDHVNHNGLDNRIANLRLATRVQNGFNRPKDMQENLVKIQGRLLPQKRQNMAG